jgi:large subunit ribosomal protein L18
MISLDCAYFEVPSTFMHRSLMILSAKPLPRHRVWKNNTVGKIIGQRALEKGVKRIVFDRNGFLYHGRIKAVSEGAREAGLKF